MKSPPCPRMTEQSYRNTYKLGPSSDSFERLFAVLRTEFLEQAVMEQGKRILDVLNEKQIAIDGKKQCGTAPREKGPK